MINSFKRIRQELEEHLSTINENTSEIQALFDYLQDLENKINKISARVDQIQLNQEEDISRPSVRPLNQTEKKIFLVLYTEVEPLSYREISDKVNLPASLVPEAISALVGKGVPLIRSFVNNQLFLKLDPDFKEIQAKENVINISLKSFFQEV